MFPPWTINFTPHWTTQTCTFLHCLLSPTALWKTRSGRAVENHSLHEVVLGSCWYDRVHTGYSEQSIIRWLFVSYFSYMQILKVVLSPENWVMRVSISLDLSTRPLYLRLPCSFAFVDLRLPLFWLLPRLQFIIINIFIIRGKSRAKENAKKWVSV